MSSIRVSREQRLLEDLTYEVENGVAWITIDRPERHNAFRGKTVDELIHCFKWHGPMKASASRC